MQGFVHIEQNLAFFVFGGDRLAGGISISLPINNKDYKLYKLRPTTYQGI